MSNEAESQNEPETVAETTWDDLTHTSDWHGAPDLVLAEMADFAEGSTAIVGVTLLVPGGVLSGQLVGADAYFDGVAERTRAAYPGDDDVAKFVDSYARTFYDGAAERAREVVARDRAAYDSGKTPSPRWPMARYIHLDQARYIAPGSPAITLGLFRVLLSQVVGWAPGTLSD